jgi:hypothetical protein
VLSDFVAQSIKPDVVRADVVMEALRMAELTHVTELDEESTQPAAAPERRAGVGNGPDRRKSVVDRRAGMERRQQLREESGYAGAERRVTSADRRASTGLERRRGPGRRLSDERKSAEEGEMNAEQFEFVMAIETYKKVNKRLYPTWTEVLEVVRQLGYRKVEHRNIKLENVPEPQLMKVA